METLNKLAELQIWLYYSKSTAIGLQITQQSQNPKSSNETSKELIETNPELPMQIGGKLINKRKGR